MSELSSAVPSAKKLVWLDCDPGHDDVVAILMASYEPNLELLGISTVHGNAHLRHTTANAARCLEAFGAPAKILVYPGAAKPLVGQPHPAVDIHGSDGLGGVEGLPSPTDPAVAARIVGIDERAGGLLPALQGMRDASLAAIRKGTKLHLAVTGAFTNAALFFSIYPELAKQAIQEVVLMGGGVGIGNITPLAEFNIFIDPEAAQIVFDFGLPVFLVPLNVTHLTLFHSTAHAYLLDPSSAPKSSSPSQAVTPLRHTLSTLLTFFAQTYRDVFNFQDGPPIHDALVIAYIARPEIFQGKVYRVDVERSEGSTKGALIVDVYGTKPNATKNVVVAENLDVAVLLRAFFNCVAEADLKSPLNIGIDTPRASEIPCEAVEPVWKTKVPNRAF